VSFVNSQIKLPNSGIHNSGGLRTCDKCVKERVPEGGVEMGPGRWHCASCWTIRQTRRKNK
jgi:hypothetical protein